MELKGWDQKRLAREMKVSRSAVNSWMNDRSYPRNAIARLEVVLGIDLSEPRPETDDRPVHVRENWHVEEVRIVWGLDRIPREARSGMIAWYLRQADGQDGDDAQAVLRDRRADKEGGGSSDPEGDIALHAAL